MIAKIAICFWGLLRSLEYTIPSIKAHVLNIITRESIKTDIYIHTYRSHTYFKRDLNESGNYNVISSMKPFKFIVENQSVVDASINFSLFATKGDPWNNNLRSLKNSIRGISFFEIS